MTRIGLRAVVIACVIVGGAGVAGRAALQQVRQPGRDTPTALVVRGDLDARVRLAGELRVAKTAMLTAPSVGGALKILDLRPSGSIVAAGDVVVRFDPSDLEHSLEQNESDLEQAEQEVVKLRADALVEAAQDRVAQLKARFAVRRAELDVSANEIRSGIEAQKNVLALDEARRALAQVEEDVRSRSASSRAAEAVAAEKRNKARLGMETARRNIESLVVRAPFGGVVALKENRDSAGNAYFNGMQLPVYRSGDQASPGRFLAEILDLAHMEVLSRIDEGDRANVHEGQRASIRVDAAPDRSAAATIKSVAGMAQRASWGGGDAVRRFDIVLELNEPTDAYRPGSTADIVIDGPPQKNVLYIPRQALFEEAGRPVVFVKASGSRFEMRDAAVSYRTESHVVIKNLEEGAEVALVHPDAARATESAAGATPQPLARGAGR